MKRTIQSFLTSLVIAAGFVLVPLAVPAGAVNVFEGLDCPGGGAGSGSGIGSGSGAGGNGSGGTGGGGSSTSICGATTDDNAQDIIRNVINLLFIVLGMLAVIMIIIGGIRYTTSNGDANATKGAKDTILYSVVGLVVAILAYAIVNFVLEAFA